MGCGHSFVPLAVQKSKKSEDVNSYTLSFSEFDQQVEWFISACNELKTSTKIKSLTIDIDKKVFLENKDIEKLSRAMISMINNMKLDHLVFKGYLNVLEHSTWKSFWETCSVERLSFSSRLPTRAMLNFVRGNAKNKETKTLLMRRSFRILEMFNLIFYLMRNNSVKHLILYIEEQSAVEFLSLGDKDKEEHLDAASKMGNRGVIYKKNKDGTLASERGSPDTHRSNKLLNVPHQRSTNTHRSSRRNSSESNAHNHSEGFFPTELQQVLDLVGVGLKPITLLANNTSITSFTLSGRINAKMSEFALAGIGMNGSIENLIFAEVQFSSACARHLQLALKLTSSIRILELKEGMNDNSSMMIFHALKENKSITTLILSDSDFSRQGFDMLNECLRVNQTISHLEIADMKFLGSTIDKKQEEQCENMILLLNGLQNNNTLEHVAIKLDYQNYLAGPDSIVFDDKNERLNSAFETMLKTNTSIQSLQLLNLRLKGETIDFIGKGMKYNTSILSLDLQGSLMEWRDMSALSSAIMENSIITKLNILNNQLETPAILQLKDKHLYTAALEYMDTTLSQVAEFQNITHFYVNHWFFDYTEYPESLMETILHARTKMKDFTYGPTSKFLSH